MPRYFFHTHDRFGESLDEVGTVFADPEDARMEALRGVRAIVAEDIIQGRPDLSGHLCVTDEVGKLVLTVNYIDAVTDRVVKPPPRTSGDAEPVPTDDRNSRIANALQRIATQEALLEHLRQSGADTRLAEEVLQLLRDTLKQWRQHHALMAWLRRGDGELAD